MPSPFPGMDPYLESPSLWEGFHHSLAIEIRDQLAPLLRPRYFADVDVKVTYDQVTIGQTRLIKPDVSVWHVVKESPTAPPSAITPAPLTSEITVEEPLKLFSVEIRKVEQSVLVTAIEILSPVNKRPGHEAFSDYQRKRRDLLRSAAHLMEIDLLRAGERWQLLTPLPDAPYFVFLSRVERRTQVEIWPLRIQEPIPILPVPLLEPDPDVPLDLGRAIQTIYDNAAYDLRIDYRQPPPLPELPSADRTWVQERLKTMGVRE